MKRLILKIVLFLLPIIILAVSLEFLLQQIPNDYTYKKNYLTEHAGEIQILILGSSDTFYGLNPVYFSQNTFNASHVSQTLDLDLKIFNKYKHNFKDLSTVIIPISYFTLWGKLEEGVEAWRIKNYALYHDMNTKSVTDNFELLNGKLSLNIQRFYKYYFKEKDAIICSELGWGTDYSSEIKNNLEKTGKAMASYHTVDDINSDKNRKIFAENIKILNTFAELCNLKNIKLIFLSTPVYRTYLENLNPEQLNIMLETIGNIVEKYENCQYINLMDDPDFTAVDFYDANHLNEIGAKKLSGKLSREIGIFSR